MCFQRSGGFLIAHIERTGWSWKFCCLLAYIPDENDENEIRRWAPGMSNKGSTFIIVVMFYLGNILSSNETSSGKASNYSQYFKFI